LSQHRKKRESKQTPLPLPTGGSKSSFAKKKKPLHWTATGIEQSSSSEKKKRGSICRTPSSLGKKKKKELLIHFEGKKKKKGVDEIHGAWDPFCNRKGKREKGDPLPLLLTHATMKRKEKKGGYGSNQKEKRGKCSYKTWKKIKKNEGEKEKTLTP